MAGVFLVLIFSSLLSWTVFVQRQCPRQGQSECWHDQLRLPVRLANVVKVVVGVVVEVNGVAVEVEVEVKAVAIPYANSRLVSPLSMIVLKAETGQRIPHRTLIYSHKTPNRSHQSLPYHLNHLLEVIRTEIHRTTGETNTDMPPLAPWTTTSHIPPTSQPLELPPPPCVCNGYRSHVYMHVEPP